MPGREREFISAWSERTEWLKRVGGSLGSRLHKGSDGIWYSYAQWPSTAARERAFVMGGDENRDRNRAIMEAIAIEALPEVILDIHSDHIDLAASVIAS